MTTTLKIDLDYYPSRDAVRRFLETRRRLLEMLGYSLERATYAYTGRGVHFYFIIREDLDPEKHLELQWLLGDDPVRVKINHYRLKKGLFPRLNILFDHVDYRRPPTDQCLKCKLWRWFTAEILGVEPPAYATVFRISDKGRVRELLKAFRDISARDPTFQYRIATDGEDYVIEVLSGDRDQAYKRGVWIKHRLLGGDARFTVREIVKNGASGKHGDAE